MQLQTIPYIHQLKLSSPKQRITSLEDSFRFDTQKSAKSEKFVKTESKTYHSEDEDSNLDQFGKTHFRARIKQLNSSKYTAFRDFQSKNSIKYLERIDQKLRKHAICSDRDRQALLTRSELFKFPGFQTTKNGQFKSPKGDSVDEQREELNELEIRPLTLKKRINMIKKHKKLMEKEFQEKKASIEYNQRALSKESYRLQTYKSKFEKVRTVREERERERLSNSLQMEMHNEEVMRRNFMLKSTVMGSQENLKNSRVSLCLEKLKLANETRVQKQQNSQEVKSFQHQILKQKKQQCEQVKHIKARTHQSVEDCSKNRIITVNQRKLQEMSRELVSLESQKKMHNTFYRTEVNESYQNKIKNKKIELQQKAKVYKANLMLELNRSQRINSIKNEEEEEMSQVRNSANTEPHRKKKDSLEISTATDLNFQATKSNCIYKRWNNPLIAERLKTEPSD